VNVLLLHNRYQQAGGEDAVFETEKALLEHMGQEVIPFVEDNARLNGMNPLKAAQNAIWSREAQSRLRRLIRETRPDVAHFHNTFLMISPAAYYACKEEGVPVVQTLHNFRLLCPAATFFRDGRVCEDCLGKAVTWPAVAHGCWRGSRAGTALVSTMLAVHRLLKTWQEQVDVYIALTEFTRQKFIEGGLPAKKIVVKPNFVDPDPGMGSHDGEYALFVGRLSLEKGVMTLLRAWKGLKGRTLKIVGDGPLLEKVQGFVIQEGLREVELLSRKPRDEIFRLMQEAQALVFPSECYEGFPMTIAEAFACGLPVIVSRLGAMAEIVEDGRTGLFFEPGDPESLIEQVQWVWEHPRELAEMGRNARREYEMKYTAEKNYQMLMEIYRKAMER
jgi:glycosyltransferase involved in cell wall biosynthesis